MKLLQPGPWPNAKGAQVHGVDNVLAAGDSMNGNRHDQRSQLAYLGKQTAAQLLNLVPARALGVHCQAEIAPEGRDETHGQIHGIGDFVW